MREMGAAAVHSSVTSTTIQWQTRRACTCAWIL